MTQVFVVADENTEFVMGAVVHGLEEYSGYMQCFEKDGNTWRETTADDVRCTNLALLRVTVTVELIEEAKEP